MSELDSFRIEIDYIKKNLDNLTTRVDVLREVISTLEIKLDNASTVKFEQIRGQVTKLSIDLSLAINEITNIQKNSLDAVKTLNEKIDRSVDGLSSTISDKLVTKDQFAPVKTIAFTIIGIAALAVFYSLIRLVTHQSIPLPASEILK
jgi:predicted translin family RNA/ssDNA-binding protein